MNAADKNALSGERAMKSYRLSPISEFRPRQRRPAFSFEVAALWLTFAACSGLGLGWLLWGKG